MKKILAVMSILLTFITWLPAYGDRLTKTPNHVYIATFNVFKLGAVDAKYKQIKDWDTDVDDDYIPERIANLAKVIAVGGFHLVSIQEVRSGVKGYYAIKDLQKALYKNHRMRYKFFISEHIGKGLIPEAMAFLYRKHKVRNRRIDGERSALIAVPGRDLVKTNWVAGKFDFTLITAHLAWGNKSHRNAGYKKIEDIFNNPSDYSKDPDIIVLGDFNRFGKSYNSVKKLPYDPSKFFVPNVTFFDPGFNVKKNVTKKSIRGKGVPGDNPQLISTTVAVNKRVYDMIMCSKDVSEEFPPGTNEAEYAKDFGIIHFDEAQGFGYQTGAGSMSHNALKKAYSDHRPLWIRFKTKGDFYDGLLD